MAWWKTKKMRKITFGAYSDIGQVRTENQDAYGHYPQFDRTGKDDQLFIVADGMGGHARGQEASQTAIEVVQRVYLGSKERSPVIRLKRAFESANQSILERSRNGEHPDRMGTTCTALAFVEGLMYLAHVGDSRAYRITQERVEKLSHDHTVVEELRRKGIITNEEAQGHPRRNALIRAVGVEESIEIDVVELGSPQPGEYYVLCSDGLAEVSEGEIQRAVLDSTPQEACETLVQIANERGGRDNVTVLVIRID